MWELDFISEEDLRRHVRNTIAKYGVKLTSYDLKRFNTNIVDPIKLIFDQSVYQLTWEEIIQNEIFRQRDKSNNNDIGYFHQNIFQYIEHCLVPESGWDIIFSPRDGIEVKDGGRVSKAYVEMKNKHNTMNSASSAKTYINMQHQLLLDDDCVCFLVEAISKQSQNEPWVVTVDKERKKHKLIRRVSIDQFYSIVTGQEDAFYRLCKVLPEVVADVVFEMQNVNIPHDTVFDELNEVAKNKDMPFIMALYMLGFETYLGFKDIY